MAKRAMQAHHDAMRALLVALSLATTTCSCDASHETMGDAGDAALIADAATLPDAVTLPDAAGDLTVTLTDPQFTTCACHHGCGPGIDGMVTLIATNATTTTHTLVVTRVVVDSIGSPGGPYTTPEDGTFRLVGAAPDGSFSIVAGTTGMLGVVVYLDIPIVEPSTDSVTIEATLDGTIVRYDLPTVSVTTAPGC
jgi:hypothetical protein